MPSYLQYRISRWTCLALLLAGCSLAMAQCVGRPEPWLGRRFNYYVFGWPLVHLTVLDWPEANGHELAKYVPLWIAHPMHFWSGRRLCVNLAISMTLLAGVGSAVETRQRNRRFAQFNLLELLSWMAIIGALISLSSSERPLIEWATPTMQDTSPYASTPWIRLPSHVYLPVLLSVACVLDTLAQALGGIASRCLRQRSPHAPREEVRRSWRDYGVHHAERDDYFGEHD